MQKSAGDVAKSGRNSSHDAWMRYFNDPRLLLAKYNEKYNQQTAALFGESSRQKPEGQDKTGGTDSLQDTSTSLKPGAATLSRRKATRTPPRSTIRASSRTQHDRSESRSKSRSESPSRMCVSAVPTKSAMKGTAGRPQRRSEEHLVKFSM